MASISVNGAQSRKIYNETNLGTCRGAHSERKQLGRLLVTFLGNLRESSCVSLYRLTNSSIPAIELHSALDLERRRICRVARNTNQNEPFLIWSNTVVDYLSAS